MTDKVTLQIIIRFYDLPYCSVSFDNKGKRQPIAFLSENYFTARVPVNRSFAVCIEWL